MGLDTKTYWLTDRQSQCDFDIGFDENGTRVKGGSNTSTVTLRDVGGDEKGSLEPETVKYCHESQGTRTRKRLHWRGPAAYVRDSTSSRQRGSPTKSKPYLSKVINTPSWAPDGARHQNLLIDWPSVAMWLWLWLDKIMLTAVVAGATNDKAWSTVLSLN
jgi:hypothetical protein